MALCSATVMASGALAAGALPDDVAQAVRAGNPVIAEEKATEALAVDTITPDERVHLLLSRALARDALGKRQDALSDLNNAIWMDLLSLEEKARALFDRGVTYDELGRTQDALNDYSAALEIKPDFAAALNDRANVERRLGRLADAKADYQAALAAGNPEKKYSYFGLGEVAAAMGDKTEAAIEFRAALAQDASYTIAAQQLAALGDVPPPLNLRTPQDDAAPNISPANPENRATHIAAVRDAVRKSVATQGGVMLQLGAYNEKAVAEINWQEITRKTAGALDRMAPQIFLADVPGKGKFWRLRIGPLERQNALALCGQLKSLGKDCWPVRD